MPADIYLYITVRFSYTQVGANWLCAFKVQVKWQFTPMKNVFIYCVIVSLSRFCCNMQSYNFVIANDNMTKWQSNSIDSLEHRCNMACVSLFYPYYNRRFSREIRGLVPDNPIFLRSTRTPRRAYPFVVDCAVNHTMNALQGKFIFWPLGSLMEWSSCGSFSVKVKILISLGQTSTNTTPSFHLPITYFPKPEECTAWVGAIPWVLILQRK